ncbi:MAG: efflux transporter outer membrane subunit [Rhodanobacteraceae bacterium]
MNKKPALACVLALVLTACAGVPDRLPAPDLTAQAPLAGLPADADSSWPDAAWWLRYQDPQLDRLMRRAMADSTSLAVARTRVAEAQRAADLSATSNGVKINGNAQVSRQRLSEHGLIPSQFLGFTWYTQADIGAQLSYSFDWWGKHRASVEAAIGQARAARASQSAAAIGLQSAVAQTYFAWQADQARLALAKELVGAQEKLVRIARVRGDAGIQPTDPLLQAKAALAAAHQQQDQLEGMAAIHHASLAALLGTSVQALGQLEVRPLPEASMRLPAHASIDLIARRPDIAASRWQVLAALRKTDVARAEFLPDLSLNALVGLSSIDMGKLVNASSRTFALTPALHLPIFEGGLLKARYGLSRAQLDSAIANYNDSIVQAARDVSQQALTIEQLGKLDSRQQEQLAATRSLLQQSTSRQQRGLTNLVPVLQARAAVLQQRDARLVLRTRALAADVELIHALGGGYLTDPETINTPLRNRDQDTGA